MSPNRYGEDPGEEPDTEAAPDVDAHECDRGWVDRDADHPMPCLVCKPHLVQRVTRIGD